MVVDDSIYVELLNFVFRMDKMFAQCSSRSDGGRNSDLLKATFEGFCDACVVRERDVALASSVVVVVVVVVIA